MTDFITPALISCDEAGFTGNRMIDRDQPFFAYASINLRAGEAAELITNIRQRHGLQMPELRAKKLLKRKRGRIVVAEVLEAIEGRYIATLYNKRLCLGAKFFEYIYEPVLQRRFMRSLDPADAPSLFCGADTKLFDVLLDPILRFARGYNVIIAQETRDLKLTGDMGKWVLDLTISAITDHLRIWGERHPILEVVCDDSKPLRALAGIYDIMINRPDVSYLEVFGKRRRLTWNMAKPIAFASSANNPAVQVADLVAGATAAVADNQGNAEFGLIAKPILRHLSEECILPDFDIIDLAGDEAPVNAFILQELAHRADNGLDPLIGMEACYAVAKASLPHFRAITSVPRV